MAKRKREGDDKNLKPEKELGQEHTGTAVAITGIAAKAVTAVAIAVAVAASVCAI